MKGLKDQWEDYKKPTPEKFRKLGDALMAVSLAAAPLTAMLDHEFIAIGILCVGILGKFLSTFFAK